MAITGFRWLSLDQKSNYPAIPRGLDDPFQSAWIIFPPHRLKACATKATIKNFHITKYRWCCEKIYRATLGENQRQNDNFLAR
jgi:hypothetical protein